MLYVPFYLSVSVFLGGNVQVSRLHAGAPGTQVKSYHHVCLKVPDGLTMHERNLNRRQQNMGDKTSRTSTLSALFIHPYVKSVSPARAGHEGRSSYNTGRAPASLPLQYPKPEGGALSTSLPQGTACGAPAGRRLGTGAESRTAVRGWEGAPRASGAQVETSRTSGSLA